MAERDRKIHVVYGSDDVTMSVCRWHVDEEREQLLSSSDGIVAIEVLRPGDPRAPHWRTVGKRIVSRLDIADAAPADVARAAFYAFAEPDVKAIHVVMPGVERTFIRDRPDWLDAPRFAHPVYSVAPRNARA